MKNGKEALYKAVEAQRELLFALNEQIHGNPELGNQEFIAQRVLTDVLAAHGFQVERQAAGLDTAFVAVYSSGEGGPNLGLLCEYDALPELGHGCAHNLQGPAMVGAALALQQELHGRPASIWVFGTPAEETSSGKIPMVKAGLFDNLDTAFMMHGSDTTTVDGKSLAVKLVDFVFTGKAAHAAIAPDQGISALDAALMLFNGVEYLREHVRSDVRIHGIITDGGKAANIVPQRACAQFYIRAEDSQTMEEAAQRVYNAARGAALMVGADVSIQEIKTYANKLNVPSLNTVLLDNARAAGAEGISPPRKHVGSTDFSCVTQRVPGASLRVKFVETGTSSHTKAWVEAGNAAGGREAIIVAAKAIAGACLDLISDSQLLAQIKSDFAAARTPGQPD